MRGSHGMNGNPEYASDPHQALNQCVEVVPEVPDDPSFFQRTDWLSFLITAVLALAVYLFTLAPEVTLEYSGIYSTVRRSAAYRRISALDDLCVALHQAAAFLEHRLAGWGFLGSRGGSDVRNHRTNGVARRSADPGRDCRIEQAQAERRELASNGLGLCGWNGVRFRRCFLGQRGDG